MANLGGVYTWSKTQANNAGADNTVNYAEGQAPSSLNDSARNAMASVAKYRDDISGAILTTGTSAAYIVASNQQFDTLANFHGQVIAFSPHITNVAGPVTITVDGFANIPLRTSPGKELLTGTIIQGTPYTATYSVTDNSLYLHGYYGNPYNVPFLGGMDFWDTIAPNSSFIFPLGQAISRTTYAAAFARWGITHGAGDGSTTFNVPNKGERVSVMKAAVATLLTTAGSGVDGATMGATGGVQNVPLIVSDVPAGVPSSGNNLIIVDSDRSDINYGGNADNFQTIAGSNGRLNISTGQQTSRRTNAIAVASTNSGQTSVKNVQPTIVCNYIIRILP